MRTSLRWLCIAVFAFVAALLPAQTWIVEHDTVWQSFTKTNSTATNINTIDNQTVSVTNATNATPIVLTFGTLSYIDGQPVTISSVGGNTNANGNFFLKHVSVGVSTTGQLYSDALLTTPVAGNSAYTSGGSCLAAAWTDYNKFVGLAGSWFTQPGGILSITVNTGGTYTGTPTLTFPTPTGSGSQTNVKATGTAVMNGGLTAMVSVNLTAPGINHSTSDVPTPSGGGQVIAATFNAPTIENTVLAAVNGGVTGSNNFGANGYLLKPAAGLSQGVKAFGIYAGSGSTGSITCGVRINPAAAQLYSSYIDWSNGLGSTPKVNIAYFNNYPTGSNTNIATGVSCTGLTLTYGHVYSIFLTATGSSPTTLQATVKDETAATTFTSSTFTDSSAGVQAQPGFVGCGIWASRSQMEELTSYQLAGFSPTPSIVPLGNTTQSIALTNTGAAWPFNSTTNFTFNANGTSAMLVSQLTSSDGLTATLVVSTGSAIGSPIITDVSSSLTSSFAIAAMIAPAARSTILSLTSSGATITSPTYATIGNATFTYKIYRGFTPNFAYTDAGTVLVSTQSGVASSVVPTPVVDTGASPGLTWWAWVVTDSTGQTVQGPNFGYYVPRAPPGFVRVGFGGDSLTVGHDAITLIQQVVTPGVLTQGSGQTNGTYPLVFTGGSGYGAAGFAVVSGGLLTYAYFTNHGWGFTSESSNLPTITYTGAGGTPGTISCNSNAVGYLGSASANTGGGLVIICQKALQTLYTFPNIICDNQGRGGSATSGWISGATGNCLGAAMAAWGSSTTTPVVHFMLGSNDANGSTSAATFGSNMTSIVGTLTAAGYKVVLSYPIYEPGISAAKNQLIFQYQAQIDAIIAANPGKVFPGWQKTLYGQMLNSPEFYFSDLIHLNDAGYSMLGLAIAQALAPVLTLVNSGRVIGG